MSGYLVKAGEEIPGMLFADRGELKYDPERVCGV